MRSYKDGVEKMIRINEIHNLIFKTDEILQTIIVGFVKTTETTIFNINILEKTVSGEYTLEDKRYSFTMKLDSSGSLISYEQNLAGMGEL
jgi:hypothetical protein